MTEIAQVSVRRKRAAPKRLTGVDIALRQAEELARRAAQDVTAFYQDREVEPEATDTLFRSALG